MAQSTSSISACILTRDSSETLEDCLRSIRSYCTHIVVVDTGSQDNSTQIAARWGADIWFHQWNNDFAEVRNFGIRHCWGEWILMIDSDEQLLTFPNEEFATYSQDPTIGGIEVTIHNLLDAQEPQSWTHTAVRLFRNHPKIHYRGRIHEQVTPSITDLGLRIVSSTIQLLHTGYQHLTATKTQRNKHLLQQELRQNPNDPYLLYHLGLTEFADTHYAKAAELLQRALASKQLTQQQEAMARIRLGQIALRLEQWDTLHTVLNFHTADPDIEGFRKYILGVAALVNKDVHQALNYFNDLQVQQSSLVKSTDLAQAIQVCQQLLQGSDESR